MFSLFTLCNATLYAFNNHYNAVMFTWLHFTMQLGLYTFNNAAMFSCLHFTMQLGLYAFNNAVLFTHNNGNVQYKYAN